MEGVMNLPEANEYLDLDKENFPLLYEEDDTVDEELPTSDEVEASIITI